MSVAPALATLGCVAATLSALFSLTYAVLGRDQGIFHYVAWALRNGEKAYRDFREINGPLPHAWNVLIQALAGEDGHAFRVVDTSFVVLIYAAAASTLPRWVGARAAFREHQVARVAWAMAGVAILGSQFARYGWWHANQREGFYAALLLGSLALQAAAHDTRSPTRATWLFGVAATLSSLTWFGKPPCVVFAVLQLFVLLFDRASLAVSTTRVLLASTVGALVSLVAMLSFVVIYEDASSAIQVLSKVPLLHHTIWHRSFMGCYRAYGNAPQIDWAFATSGGFIAAYFVLDLPRRSLLALVLPIGGMLVFVGQGKAFPYHLHMVTLGTSVAQLVILAGLARRGRARADVVTLLTAAAATALGLKCRQDARMSAAGRSDWASVGSTAEKRSSAEYLARFPWGDFSIADLHRAAAFVAENTKPSDRIQTYGLDPYFLFLARRHTATPFIYNFELNIDQALEGGPGARLDAAQRLALQAHRDAAEATILALSEVTPPAAFVFFDNAPFGHPADGEKDFADHCPTLYRWVDDRYAATERLGTIRVRLLRR